MLKYVFSQFLSFDIRLLTQLFYFKVLEDYIKGNRVVLVYLFATSYEPSTKLEVKLEEFVKKYPKIIFVKVDADECRVRIRILL